MSDHYLNLFFATGSPLFYLLHRYEAQHREDEAKTAWCDERAEWT